MITDSRLVGAFSSVVCLVVFAGCVTAHKTPPAAPPVVHLPEAPVEPARPAPPPAVPVTPTSANPAPTPPPPLTPAGEVTMLVESVPPGAVIVVDGRPVGKTPLRLGVPATPLGFLRNYVEIRARFLATTEGADSRTATEEFTPRERVPATLHFTPDGAQRTVR